MSKVIFTMSASVDGMIRAADPTPNEPLGKGGERLHEWAFGDDPKGRDYLERAVARLGAVITGRRTYEDSIRWWGPDGPTGRARLPVFVVTHQVPRSVPDDSVYRFVTGGVEEAVREAKEAAGGGEVSIMGGPDIGNQALVAGLVDEIGVTIVPVLFGGGTPFFETLPRHIQLEKLSVVDQPEATHIRYRIKPES